MKKLALVTGANRGLGFQTCLELGKLGYQVILGSRKKDNAEKAAAELKKHKVEALIQILDVDSKESVVQTQKFIEKEFSRLDVLVNNAGVFMDSKVGSEVGIFDVGEDIVAKTFNSNLLGP
jgi:NAD(P)-dependent dehydrogenase (short-subunit alcohol dehydrogenase family)